MSRKKFSFKKKYKMNNKKTSVILTIGMILLIFALLSGVYAIFKNNKESNEIEGYELCDVTWKRGTIDTITGEYVSNKEYLYSSIIKVDSVLKIKREFTSHISYIIYYYDELGNLVYVDDDKESTSNVFKGYKDNYEKNIDNFELEEGQVIDHARIVMKWLDNDDDELSIRERLMLKKKINVYVSRVDTNSDEEEGA